MRLLTFFEEAKALNDAGYPQDTDASGTWIENTGRTFSSRSGLIGKTFYEGLEVYRRPRLDELLAWLWSNGHRASIDVVKDRDDGSYRTIVQTYKNNELDFNRATGQEPISLVVKAVLHTLSSPTNPTTK